MAEREYTRLTRPRHRSGFAVFSPVRSSLWLGKDHVLSIDTTGYTESYKRFYFRDIQALIIRKTDRGKIVSLALGVLAGLFAVFALVARDNIILRYIFLSLCALLGLFLLLNVASGPTSICHLRTAVQIEEVPSLGRLRRARKVAGRLRPLIAAAQGHLGPEEIMARLHPAAESPTSASTPATSASQDVSPTPAEQLPPPETG